MRAPLTAALAVAVCLGGCQLLGCAVAPNSGSSCTVTPFISPTSVTLDHTVKGNSQQFTTGYSYSGTNCAIPQVLVLYQWGVSDTIDATITSPSGTSAGGVASCTNAALNPITVSSYILGYSGTPPVATLTATNLPSATLTCK
jgi:hypothetical protein